VTTAAQVTLATTKFKAWELLVLLTAGAWTLGCGGGGAGSVAPPPPPPPPSIVVTVTPTNAVVVLGNAQSLMATVAKNKAGAVRKRSMEETSLSEPSRRA
jgi:hypothetical protein